MYRKLMVCASFITLGLFVDTMTMSSQQKEKFQQKLRNAQSVEQAYEVAQETLNANLDVVRNKPKTPAPILAQLKTRLTKKLGVDQQTAQQYVTYMNQQLDAGNKVPDFADAKKKVAGPGAKAVAADMLQQLVSDLGLGKKNDITIDVLKDNAKQVYDTVNTYLRDKDLSFDIVKQAATDLGVWKQVESGYNAVISRYNAPEDLPDTIEEFALAYHKKQISGVSEEQAYLVTKNVCNILVPDLVKSLGMLPDAFGKNIKNAVSERLRNAVNMYIKNEGLPLPETVQQFTQAVNAINVGADLQQWITDKAVDTKQAIHVVPAVQGVVDDTQLHLVLQAPQIILNKLAPDNQTDAVERALNRSSAYVAPYTDSKVALDAFVSEDVDELLKVKNPDEWVNEAGNHLKGMEVAINNMSSTDKKDDTIKIAAANAIGWLHDVYQNNPSQTGLEEKVHRLFGSQDGSKEGLIKRAIDKRVQVAPQETAQEIGELVLGYTEDGSDAVIDLIDKYGSYVVKDVTGDANAKMEAYQAFMRGYGVLKAAATEISQKQPDGSYVLGPSKVYDEYYKPFERHVANGLLTYSPDKVPDTLGVQQAQQFTDSLLTYLMDKLKVGVNGNGVASADSEKASAMSLLEGTAQPDDTGFIAPFINASEWRNKFTDIRVQYRKVRVAYYLRDAQKMMQNDPFANLEEGTLTKIYKSLREAQNTTNDDLKKDPYKNDIQAILKNTNGVIDIFNQQIQKMDTTALQTELNKTGSVLTKIYDVLDQLAQAYGVTRPTKPNTLTGGATPAPGPAPAPAQPAQQVQQVLQNQGPQQAAQQLVDLGTSGVQQAANNADQSQISSMLNEFTPAVIKKLKDKQKQAYKEYLNQVTPKTDQQKKNISTKLKKLK